MQRFDQIFGFSDFLIVPVDVDVAASLEDFVLIKPSGVQHGMECLETESLKMAVTGAKILNVFPAHELPVDRRNHDAYQTFRRQHAINFF